MQFGSRLTQAIILDQRGNNSHDTSFIFKKKKKRIKIGTIFTLMLLPITMYNNIFVPLQFAFRIDYSGIFLAMELVTIVAYFAHLIFHIIVY